MNLPLATLISIFTMLTLNAKTEPTPIWGKTGHRVVGAIAEKHLDNQTKRKLDKLLDNQTLAMASTFADEIKYDAQYDKFKPWHYLNMPLDSTYETSKKNPEGDLVFGIAFCKKVVTDENSSDEDKAFYLKFLIHLIGDLHQPMHLGLLEDRGGNDFDVQWFYRDTNLHKVWDSQMLDGYNMSYSEYVDNAYYLSKKEIKAIEKGDVLDWIAETHKLTVDIYNYTEEGENLRSEYSFKYFKIARLQMQKAGIRLAKVLNEIL